MACVRCKRQSVRLWEGPGGGLNMDGRTLQWEEHETKYLPSSPTGRLMDMKASHRKEEELIPIATRGG